MSSNIIPITTLHLCSNFNKPYSPCGSFNSQTKSIRTQSWPLRASATTRMNALDGPRETLYQLLGIEETGSSFSDIKKAYKEMAKKYHPDASPPERVDENTRRFIMVHEAYETLSDPQTRASYDRYLEGRFGLGIPFSAHQMEEKTEWKKQWLCQLDELKRRGPKRRDAWGCSNA